MWKKQEAENDLLTEMHGKWCRILLSVGHATKCNSTSKVQK